MWCDFRASQAALHADMDELETPKPVVKEATFVRTAVADAGRHTARQVSA
jgi:hypothetical protein